MKRVVFFSVRWALIFQLCLAVMTKFVPILSGQYIQPGGVAVSEQNAIVPAYYSSATPETKIVPSQYGMRQGEIGLVEPKPLTAPSSSQSIFPVQSLQYPHPGKIAVVQHVESAPLPGFSTRDTTPVMDEPPARTQLPTGTPLAAPAAPARLIAAESITKNYRLQRISAEQFEEKLVGKLGKRFVPIRNVETSTHLSRFRMPVKDGTDIELSVDRQNQMATIIGSAAMVESCLQIVRLLDTPANGTETATEFVPVQRGSLIPVKQAATVVNRESQKGAVDENVSNVPKTAQNTPAFRQDATRSTARFGNADASPPGAAPQTTTEGGGAIVGPVQIDIIDGLDTMVIRGNPRDVATIRAMIDQIEAMSLEHEPLLELVPMRHADSYRISQMVQQLYAQVYQARRGSITMIPLVKPNTILMIGKKESIDTAKELVAKLDTAVDPASEFLIIRLKNASSDTLQTQITQFYANRSGQGLETQVFVVSDFRTNALIVQGNPRDLTEIASMVRQLDTPGSDALNAVKTFSLKNAMASELATTLQNAISGTGTGATTGGGFGAAQGTGAQSSRTRNPMLTMGTIDEEGNLQRASVLYDVRVVADTRSNTLIVTAPQDSMPLIEALIKQLDQLPSAESQIKVFTLVNGDASALTTVLQNLFATTSSSSGGGFGGGTQGTSQIATVRPGIEEGESTLVSVRFQTDTRTNSIIACGSAGDMSVVEALLLRLDEENMNNRKVMVLKLVNTPASDIATAIQNYVTNERQLEIQNSSTYYPQSPQEQYRKEVVVVPEEISNSLIVSTTPRYYDQIRRMVAALDERPLMVAIEVLIAEVRLSNNRERGIEVGLQDSLLFDRSLVTSNDLTGGVDALFPGFLFGDPSTGLPLGNVRPGNVGTQGITSLGVNRVGSSGQSGFVFSASSESVSVLIRALEEQSKLRVLSRPHLTTMHNMRATIQVGQEVPFVSGSNSSGYGSTTSQIDWKEVGTILDVTPRITPDGMIVMAVYVEKSSVSNAEGIPTMVSGGQTLYTPKINTTNAQTTVSALDGQTIVFAGLITEEKETVNRSVPFLNKIPVVKHLFEYDSKSCYRSELLIVMTPTVIRSESDLEMIRHREASRMHWCISDVVKLTGDKKMRMRGDHWCSSEMEYMRPEPVFLDETMLPAEENIRREMPFPTLAPGDE